MQRVQKDQTILNFIFRFLWISTKRDYLVRIICTALIFHMTLCMVRGRWNIILNLKKTVSHLRKIIYQAYV